MESSNKSCPKDRIRCPDKSEKEGKNILCQKCNKFNKSTNAKSQVSDRRCVQCPINPWCIFQIETRRQKAAAGGREGHSGHKTRHLLLISCPPRQASSKIKPPRISFNLKGKDLPFKNFPQYEGRRLLVFTSCPPRQASSKI